MTDRDEDEDEDARREVDRRRFLAGAGAIAGGAAIEVAAARAAQKKLAAQAFPQAVSISEQVGAFAELAVPSFSVLVRRREDMLFLRVEGYNLVRKRQALVRKTASHDAYLVIGHLPQHLAEEAFQKPGGTPKPPGQALARLAYPTRLAFLVPKRVRSIPYTLDGLLDWEALEPSLVPAADFGTTRASSRAKTPTPAKTTTQPTATKKPTITLRKPPPLRAPTKTETAIELPWRLALSPLPGGRWSHPTTVKTLGGWSELWHTRLSGSPDEKALDGAPIRAVWNYDVTASGKPTLSGASAPANDWVPPKKPKPFRTSLNANVRWQIVKASSDFKVKGRADVQARKLWLSSRGGYLDSRGFWDGLPNLKFNLEEWKHLATQGRDQYVKVVLKGFLFPFGHRCVQVVISERQFEKVGSQTEATFRQITYLVIRQPDVSYDPALTFGILNNSRDLPFRNLHITTPRTPDLNPPTAFVTSGANKPDLAFVPVVSGGPFQFHFVGTDWAERRVEFTAPGVFVGQPDGIKGATSKAVRDVYNTLTDGVTNVGHFQGQTVAFGASKKLGDTDFPTNSIMFGAGAGAAATDQQYSVADQPRTYPNVRSASVRLSAAEQASGGQPLDKTPVVAFHPGYVTGGGFNTPANPGNVFLQVLDTHQPKLDFGGGSSGGVITPNLLVSGLSRSLGPVAGDLDKVAGGTFDPTSIFKDIEARILGGVNLIDLVLKTLISGDTPTDEALKITYDTSGSTLTTHLRWTPVVSPDNPIIEKGPNCAFELDGLVTTDLAQPEKSTFKIDGLLNSFVVHLMSRDDSDGFIAIHFNKLTFKAGNGQKSDVDVDIESVEFLGVLKFVEELQSFLDFSGDGGPKIEVTPTGISADLSVPLPDISVGILSLSNIAIGAGFNLPFNGSPARFRFSFSTRENPFALSVAIFGGAGFFGLAIGTDGVELIEASLEFGAMCAINLGIASGSVHLTAGIYFSYGQDDKGVETCVLSGFVKLGGSLSILGIITLSLEFDLSLTYTGPDPAQVTGTATLSVEVSILFFSFSVSVSASKTFGGGEDGTSSRRPLGQRAPATTSPPRFIDQVPPDSAGGSTSTAWNSYCDAFATN